MASDESLDQVDAERQRVARLRAAYLTVEHERLDAFAREGLVGGNRADYDEVYTSTQYGIRHRLGLTSADLGDEDGSTV